MSRKAIAAAAALAIESGKDSKVEAERARLLELFAGADPNRLDFIRDAVFQVAWLGITIGELQSVIDEKGPVIPYDNGGNQRGLQANPACKILKDYQQLYNTLFRSLMPVLPDKPRTPGKLEEFINDFRKDADTDSSCDDLPLDSNNV